MADVSVDGFGRTVAGSLKGVIATHVGSTPNTLLGSAASIVGNVGGGLITGATSAAENALSGMVGGSANLKALEGAASKAFGTVSGLLSGETTFTELGDKLTGTISDFFSGDSMGELLGGVGGKLLGLTGLENDLGSDWGNLSPLLMARLFVCDAKGIADVSEYEGVYGPLVDGSFEVTQNWQSPFENVGPETKAPALMAMIQSGSLVPVLNALQAVNPNPNSATGQALDAGADTLKRAVRELEGRTGITKLNSRQVFSGMPPVRLTFTQEFRATHDALKEVEQPLQRLLEWVFPQELAEDGILSEVLQTSRDVESFIKALFPSRAPKLIGLTYAGRTFAPMVVESVNYPLDAPKDSNGNAISLQVQVNMATLTALDRSDIKRFFARV